MSLELTLVVVFGVALLPELRPLLFLVVMTVPLCCGAKIAHKPAGASAVLLGSRQQSLADMSPSGGD